MAGDPSKAKADSQATVDATATVNPAPKVDPKTPIDATATMTPAATVGPKARSVEPAPDGKRGKHRGLLVALGVMVVGLVVFSAMAMFGDDDPKPSPSSSAATAVPQTTIRPQPTTVAPSPTTVAGAAGESTPAGDGSTPGAAATASSRSGRVHPRLAGHGRRPRRGRR